MDSIGSIDSHLVTALGIYWAHAVTIRLVLKSRSGKEDILVLRISDVTMHAKLVTKVWNTIRTRGEQVHWYQLVWSWYGIPRHSIHLWLVMRRRMKTQDRLKDWDVAQGIVLQNLRCELCGEQQDSLEHLFFECTFSAKVWLGLIKYVELPCVDIQWERILYWLVPLANQNKMELIVGRLLLAATTYYLWQERNNRVHGKPKRNEEVLLEMIKHTVRLKLGSIRFKQKTKVMKLRHVWRIAWDQNSSE